jgi:hypothetical protein
MKKYAFISDVNANLEALTAIIAHIDHIDGADTQIFCLGNTIGLGADPLECMLLLKSRGHCLKGYNELLVSEARIGDCPLVFVQETLHHAKKELQNSGLWDWFCTCPRVFSCSQFSTCHGDPLDATCHPIFQDGFCFDKGYRKRILSSFDRTLFIGGNYTQWIGSVTGEVHLASEIGHFIHLDSTHKTVISVGSAGQSRGESVRARYVLATPEAVHWREVEYDVKSTVEKICSKYRGGKEFILSTGLFGNIGG